MSSIARPGRPTPDYFSAPIDGPRPGPRPVARPSGPRPGYTPPVKHNHGSRRQEQYVAIDDRKSIAEQMDEETFWAREERKNQEWRPAPTGAAIHALMHGTDSAKRSGPRTTKDHRVVIHELARELALTSAQMLVIVNKQFGEYAKCASSTIATVVANDIRAWMLLPEATPVVDGVRNGTF